MERLFAFLNSSGLEEIDSFYDRHPELSRMLSHGYANGYVAIPPSHPFYKMDYDEVNKHVNVHGGLTYGASVEIIDDDWLDDIECIGFDSVDEIPKDYWFFGFDTMHAYDGPHLDRDWCINEAKSLMKQLEEARN